MGQWWADFSANFSKWLATLNWGDVPTWVASILTSVSVLLAVIILFSDKRSRRRDEVMKLVISERFFGDYEASRLEVTVYNANSHPLPWVTLRYWGGLIWHTKFFKTPEGTTEISPGGFAVVSVPWEFDGNWNDLIKDKNFLLNFTDSRGNDWYRGLNSKSVISKRRARHWFRRGQLKYRWDTWKQTKTRSRAEPET